MNKSELIDAIANATDLSKASATKALEATLEAVTQALANKEQVTLIGFGTFYVKERAARIGRNPQTGEPLNIAAANTPGFRAGKALKVSINS